jgi:hypothetical protein
MENLQIQQRRQRPEAAAGSSAAELPTPSSSSSHLKSVPSDSNLNKEGNNNEGL